MRNLKKILALVLALMMTLSLMVTASAAVPGTDYADDASITKYDEAVQVLTQLGVFRGNDKDEFNPNATITRAEAAAIVYRIVSGDVTDAQVGIYVDYNKFADVPSTAWYAGYVNFCANGEYIKGDGTNFYPTAKMTGYELLAIILRAIGYGQQGEYEGTNWRIRTATDSKALGITNTVTEGTLGAPITRAVVAELLFRGIAKTQTVTYSLLTGYQKQNATIGSTMFGLAGTQAVASAIAAGIPVSDAYLGDLLNRDDTTANYDIYGEPYYVWYTAGGTIEYYLNPKATYTTFVADDVLFAAAGVTGPSVTAHKEVDGKVQSWDTEPLYKDPTTVDTTYGGKGVRTELYVLEDGTAAISVVNTYVDIVDSAWSNGSITLGSWGSVTDTAGLTKGLAAGTVVLYTKYETTASGVYEVDAASIHAAKSVGVNVTDTYDTNNVATSYFLAGTKYEYSAKYDSSAILDRDDSGFQANRVAFFDDYNYVIYTAVPSTTTQKGWLLVRSGTYGGQLADNRYYANFSVILADGTQTTVKGALGQGTAFYATQADASDAKAAGLALYAYEVIDGYYKLSAVTSGSQGTITTTKRWEVNDRTQVKAGDADALTGSDYLLDDETVFIIANYDATGAITGYNIVKGFKNIPDLTGKSAVPGGTAGYLDIEKIDNDGDHTIDLVFVQNAVQTSDVVGVAQTDNVFYLVDTIPQKYVITYDTHKVVKGGAVTTLNFVPGFVANNSLNQNTFYTITSTIDGYVNGVSGTAVVDVDYAAPGVLKVDSSYVAMANNCVVYNVTAGRALTSAEIAVLDSTGVVAAYDVYGFATVVYVK